MSTLRQFCPQCGRALELPASAVGRQAKCPACEATFQVAEPSTSLPDSTMEPKDARRSDGQSPWASQNPMDRSYQSAPPDPYAPSYSPTPVTRVENVEIVERAIEDVFGPSWSIFAERWPPLILSMLIVGVVGFVAMGIPFLLFMLLANNNGEEIAALSIIALSPILIFASMYGWVGITRVSLAVARNQPGPLAELLPPMNLVWRMLVVGMILLAIAILPLLLIGGAIGGIAFAFFGEQGMALSLLSVGGIFVLLSALAQIFIWPLPFVVCDDRSTALGSIKIAFAISMQNKLTSFLLYLISLVLSMIGSSVCYVGIIVTQPLTLLVFAVGYLLMTNQQIANPRVFQPPYPEPPRNM